MDKDVDIAILGAGIGGLTTAIALYQKGFKNIHVFERRKQAPNIGAGLVLWSNVGKILEALDLFNAVKKIGGGIDQMQRWTDTGEFLGAIDISNLDSLTGSYSVSISRENLQFILIKKVKELKLPIHYGHKAIKTTAGTLTFENGIHKNADIIIGADGRMDSTARKYVTGNNTPVYGGFVNWISIVESDKPIFKANHVMDYWGCGERFGIVPINNYTGYWAGGKSLPLNSSYKNQQYKLQLLDLFDSWPEKIKSIIELTKAENIKYIEVFDHDPITKWYKNNVCLIGDAAHAALPTSGQGACQAIEDAWHFANIVNEAKTLEQAFDQFQQLRLEKNTTINISGRELAKSIFNENPLFCKLRNESAKNLDYNSICKGMAQLWTKNIPV